MASRNEVAEFAEKAEDARDWEELEKFFPNVLFF
jgi:hypothetical protein